LPVQPRELLLGFAFMNRIASSEELRREYDLRFASMQDYRVEVWKVLTGEFFQKFVPEGAAVLDLGCGWGEFVNQIRAAKKFGMDLNPESRNRLDADVEFFQQDCSARWPLEDASLDVVFTSNFFEHLLSKEMLRSTIAEVHRCLKPGGKIIALGPNIRFLPGTYWDFWDHHVALTDRSLCELFTLQGLRIARCHPRFLPYTMARGSRPPLLFLRMYLKLPLFWPLLGRQFLVVGEK
jgi:SAM-dependent methyltransferase